MGRRRGWGINFENQSCCPIYFKRVFGAVLGSPHHKTVTFGWCDWPALLRKIILEPQWPPNISKGSGEGAVVGEQGTCPGTACSMSASVAESKYSFLFLFSLLNGKRNVTNFPVAVSVVLCWGLLSRFLVSEVLKSCFIKYTANVSWVLAEVRWAKFSLPCFDRYYVFQWKS